MCIKHVWNSYVNSKMNLFLACLLTYKLSFQTAGIQLYSDVVSFDWAYRNTKRQIDCDQFYTTTTPYYPTYMASTIANRPGTDAGATLGMMQTLVFNHCVKCCSFRQHFILYIPESIYKLTISRWRKCLIVKHWSWFIISLKNMREVCNMPELSFIIVMCKRFLPCCYVFLSGIYIIILLLFFSILKRQHYNYINVYILLYFPKTY